jgi:hypothetical protein
MKFSLIQTSVRVVATLGGLAAMLVLQQSTHAQTVTFQTSFESADSYSLASLDSQNGWQVTQGAASVTSSVAFTGSRSVALAASTTPAIIARSFTQFSGQPVIFVDFFARPTAGSTIGNSTLFDAESSRAGFLQVGSAGEVYAFDGDGSGSGSWVGTGRTLSIDSNSQSEDWARFTFRQDYSLKKWDLYVDGDLVAYHLGFRDDTKTLFSAFTLQAAADGAVGLDDFYVSTANPLFTDSDNDSIDDAWEQRQFGTLVYGPEDDPGDVGRTVLESYMGGLSPWPTPTVASGLEGWYRADLGMAIDGSNKVSQWTDLSGHGSHLLQSNSTKKPAWSATAFNAEPVVSFDGGDQLLTTGNSVYESTGNDVTIIAVMAPASTQAYFSTLLDHGYATGDASNLYGGFILQQNYAIHNRYRMCWGAGSQISQSPDANVSNRVQVLTIVKDGTASRSYLDGALQDTATVPSALVVPGASLSLGSKANGDSGFTGQVAEVLIYNRALTTTEREAIEAALAARYVASDSDSDGLPDAWELQYLGTLQYDGSDDPGDVGRTLEESYTGSLNPWPAPTVASGLRAWYRADLGLDKDGSANVTDWVDLSGHATHLSQSGVPGKRPSWIADAFNSHPAVAFDGSRQLRTNGPVDLQAGNHDVTIIAVMAPGGTQGYFATLLDHNCTISDGYILQQFYATQNRYSLWWGTADDARGATANLVAEQVHVLTIIKNGSTAYTYSNGILQESSPDLATLSAPAAALSLGSRLAGDYGFSGRVAEMLVYNRALSSTEQGAIESDLMGKYINADMDGDGLPDAWEVRYLGTLIYGPNDDPGNVGRSLAESYAGTLNPWPPATVSSGLRAWYRSDTGVARSGDRKVSQWTDISGAGVHLKQVAQTNLQPTWTDQSFNGYPAITFDGSSFVRTDGPFNLQDGENNVTVIAVMKPAATQNYFATLIDHGFDGDYSTYEFTGYVFDQFYSTENRYNLWWSTTGNVVLSPDVNATAGQVQVVTMVKDGTDSKGYLNGVLQDSNTVPNTLLAPIAPVAVGARLDGDHGFTGDVAELIIYNRALTTTERETVESELMTKYVVPDSDDDGLPDAWEMKNFGTLAFASTDDPGDVGRTIGESFAAGLSPWPSPTVETGLRAWYRADVGVGNVGTDKVSQLTDLSGHGAHIVQTSSTALQPTLVENAFGDHPAVSFDGSQQLRTSAETELQAGENDVTVIAVLAPDASQVRLSTAIDYGFDLDYTNHVFDGFGLRQDGDSTNRFLLGWGTVGDLAISPEINVTASQPQVVTYVKSGAHSYSYRNGSLQGSNDVAATLLAPAANFSLGARLDAGYGFQGKIAEVLIYNRTMSDADREAVESALITKYITSDSDADGLPDAWELKYFGTLGYGAGDDPGAVGRTLSASYTGTLNPWPAADVSTGLKAWFRADLGVVQDGSHNVSRWTDLSGNGAHVSQTALPDLQPAWVSSALNSHPVLSFDGTQHLRTNSPVNVEAGETDLTVIAVMVPNSTQAHLATVLDHNYLEDNTGHHYRGIALRQNVDATNQYRLSWATTSSAINATDIPEVASQAQVLTVVKRGATASSFLNGVLQGSNSVPTALMDPAGVLSIGAAVSGANGYEGDIAELFVYNRALTTAEQGTIENAMATRYGITGESTTDSDGNGLADAWEIQYFGHLGVIGSEDSDGDGQTNAQEQTAGTNPVDYYNGRGFVLGTLSGTPGVSYSYDGAGRVIGVAYLNGGTVQLTHDAASNLASFIAANNGSIVDWRTAHSLPSDGTGSGADTAIVSSDGLPNLAKYAFGLDPNTAITIDHPAVRLATISGSGYLELSYQRPDPVNGDVVYTVEVSSNGTTWTSGPGATVEVSNIVSSGTATITVRDATPVGSSSFGRRIRVRIERRTP